MPQEIAATLSRRTSDFTMLRDFIQPMQSASATHAPVIEAVRVPPSASSTSQSTVIWRSPKASRLRVVRSERPIRRWISTVRPLCFPAEASRRVRCRVARGSMPYSAVIQPRPWPLSQGGSRSSSVAVTRTWVSPNFTKQEPSAYLTTPRSSETARSSSGARRLGRMAMSFGRQIGGRFVSRAGEGGKGRYTGILAKHGQPRPEKNTTMKHADVPFVIDFHTHMLDEELRAICTSRNAITGFGKKQAPPSANLGKFLDPELQIADKIGRASC